MAWGEFLHSQLSLVDWMDEGSLDLEFDGLVGSLDEMLQLCPDSERTHCPPNGRVSRHIGSLASHRSLEYL